MMWYRFGSQTYKKLKTKNKIPIHILLFHLTLPTSVLTSPPPTETKTAAVKYNRGLSDHPSSARQEKDNPVAGGTVAAPAGSEFVEWSERGTFCFRKMLQN